MSIGKASDFKIYQDQLHAGMVETLTQQTDLFNAASHGAIVMRTQRSRGEYKYDSFFKSISSLVSRRDTTSVSAATDLALTQDELISVKVNRKVGPVAQTLDAFRKLGQGAGDSSLSFLIGTQIAKGIQADMLNTGLRAARAALANQSTNLYTVPTSGTLATAGLVSGLAKMGDNAADVVLWVGHSKPYYDLVAAQIAANVDGLSAYNVQTGTPVTLGRPFLVTDSTSLVVTTGTGTAAVTDYYTLGLTAAAIDIIQSEDPLMYAEIVTGLENLVVRLQGEHAYNLGLAGFKWDVQNGAGNPTDSSIGTGSNWDMAVTDYKDLAGVVVKSR